MTDRPPISIVFDTSAIVAYTEESIHVGEVMTEVRDNGGLAGIPVICLVEAARRAADAALLDVLVTHETTVLLDCAADDWRPLVENYPKVQRLDATSAAVEASARGAFILSGEPQVYDNLDPDSRWWIIPLR